LTNSIPIPCKTEKKYSFPFGVVTINSPKLEMEIDPSYLFDDNLIVVGNHKSKINKIFISYNDQLYNPIKTDYNPNPNIYGYNQPILYKDILKTNFKISRNTYQISHGIGVNDSEQISESFNEVNFICHQTKIDSCVNEDELENFIKDILFPYYKDSIIENFEREALFKEKIICEKNFMKKVNEVVINDAFAFIYDLVNECTIVNVDHGYIFKIPLDSSSALDITYKLDDTMINLLFELSEGINKIKMEYEKLDSHISFNKTHINILFFPEKNQYDQIYKAQRNIPHLVSYGDYIGEIPHPNNDYRDGNWFAT
jgi:hypothetical protein